MITSVARWFDLKAAILGALLMATLVGLVNSAHGLLPAMTAAGKQAAYTFFVAGFIMQFCRWLAARPLKPSQAVTLATLLPSAITVVLVFALHSYKGTPEPVLSTIPVAVLGLVSFFLISRQLVLAPEVD
jgi:ABC-type xylose transport system permease subunit